MFLLRAPCHASTRPAMRTVLLTKSVCVEFVDCPDRTRFERTHATAFASVRCGFVAHRRDNTTKSPVSLDFLKVWRKNHKQQKGQKGPKVSLQMWRQYDWQQLLRSLPSLHSLEGSPDQLAVVSFDLSPACTSVVLVNPALFVATLDD